MFAGLLGPVSRSLATPEGRIYKSVKSKLLNVLEERIKTVDEIPSKSSRIYDGMCIIHQLPKIQSKAVKETEEQTQDLFA